MPRKQTEPNPFLSKNFHSGVIVGFICGMALCLIASCSPVDPADRITHSSMFDEAKPPAESALAAEALYRGNRSIAAIFLRPMDDLPTIPEPVIWRTNP